MVDPKGSIVKALLAKIWAAFVPWIQTKSKAVASAIYAGIGMAIAAAAGQILAGVSIGSLNWDAIGVAFATGFFGAFGWVFAAPANLAIRRALKHRRGYGRVVDLPDARDHAFTTELTTPLPATVDLRPKLPPVYDQGQLGSCTANAIAAAYDYDRGIQGLEFIGPSRLFIYYNERALEGTISSDSGAQIRDGIKTLKSNGVPAETVWPYKPSKFATKPSKTAVKDATLNEALSYARVAASLTAIQHTLAAVRPVVIGFTVYESFESDAVASSGIMPMPAKGEKVLGGHAVLVVGYKKIGTKLYWIVRNSWGTSWGDDGYFYMPAEYLLSSSLASDFWVVQTVSQNAA